MNQTGSRHNSSLTYIFLIFNKNINAARQRTRNELVCSGKKNNWAKVYLKLNLYSNITTTVINLPVVYFYPILSFTLAGWQFECLISPWGQFWERVLLNEIMHYSVLLCKAKKEDKKIVKLHAYYGEWYTMISFLHSRQFPMYRILILADIRPMGYKLSCCGSIWSG